MLLHNRQKFNDHLGDGANEDLTLSTLLGIIDALESIVQHADKHHYLKVSACWYDSKGNEWMDGWQTVGMETYRWEKFLKDTLVI